MKLSLTMIVRDEAAVLARCLDSVCDLVDEIVIADTGSKDDTRAIAERYTEHVFDLPWRQNFAAARNAAIDRAHGDYILWMDADDILPQESRAGFAELKKLLQERAPDVVMCPYAAGELIFCRERIFKREARFRFLGRVHECVQPSGVICHSDVCFRHLGSAKERGTRNLDIYRLWEREEKLSPRDLYYYGRELYYHAAFGEAIKKLEQMLGPDGWYVNQIDACRIISRCRLALGDRTLAKGALLRSFLYGEPRAAAVCELAALLQEEGKTEEAIFWYRSALSCRDHGREGDFEIPAYRTGIPLLALCELYLLRGDMSAARNCLRLAEEHHADPERCRALREKLGT